MTQVERLFRHLVNTLSRSDPARLKEPLPISEIRQSLIPYRTHRRALQLENSEDYELLLMRLCAGEGGLAITEPSAARTDFEIEIGSSNPDLSLVERHDKAVLRLNPQAVEKALRPESDSAFAPFQPPSPPPSESPAAPPPTTETPRSNRCPRCGGGLPLSRKVNFCPQCGLNLAITRCPRCNEEVETGWKHCVSCGSPIPHPG